MAFRQVYEYGNGEWEKDAAGAWSCTTQVYYLSEACNHCDSPACFAACSQGAIVKDEDTGLGLHRRRKVRPNCGACAEACPYGIPKADAEKGVYVKCDGCKDRVAQGKKPICVEALRVRALDFGDIEKQLRSDFGYVAAIAPLPDPSQTNPNIVITEPKNARPIDDTQGAVLNAGELV